MLLRIEQLDVFYGRNHAVKAMSLDLDAGEIVTVLGANGAGKSSLLKAIQGTVPAASGRVFFKGTDISRWSAARRVASGIVMVPEGRQIFVNMTVHENLLLGAYTRRDDTAAEIDAIYARFPNLAQRRDMQASVLSGGEQQMLAVGRGLLARPEVMMLDEPSLGLSPILVKQLFKLIVDLNRNGLAILLVEQNTSMALSVARHGYVLERGRTVMQGTPAEILSNERLTAAYLGQA
ncbi:MAG: ABC transporter ATP-binding protein [Betaproteobacteria bacterium]|nr:ABC transporter ATP-binding protein [Betaproteobacteria bacterium]